MDELEASEGLLSATNYHWLVAVQSMHLETLVSTELGATIGSLCVVWVLNYHVLI